MTESMRLIPTEEHQRLKKLEEQLKEANEVIKVFRKENWRYGGEFVGVSGSHYSAQEYIDKWNVK